MYASMHVHMCVIIAGCVADIYYLKESTYLEPALSNRQGVKVLVELADVNEGEEPDTPICQAVLTNKKEIVHILLQHGVRSVSRALTMAREAGYDEIVGLLLKHLGKQGDTLTLTGLDLNVLKPAWLLPSLGAMEVQKSSHRRSASLAFAVKKKRQSVADIGESLANDMALDPVELKQYFGDDETDYFLQPPKRLQRQNYILRKSDDDNTDLELFQNRKPSLDAGTPLGESSDAPLASSGELLDAEKEDHKLTACVPSHHIPSSPLHVPSSQIRHAPRRLKSPTPPPGLILKAPSVAHILEESYSTRDRASTLTSTSPNTTRKEGGGTLRRTPLRDSRSSRNVSVASTPLPFASSRINMEEVESPRSNTSFIMSPDLLLKQIQRRAEAHSSGRARSRTPNQCTSTNSYLNSEANSDFADTNGSDELQPDTFLVPEGPAQEQEGEDFADGPKDVPDHLGIDVRSHPPQPLSLSKPLVSQNNITSSNEESLVPQNITSSIEASLVPHNITSSNEESLVPQNITSSIEASLVPHNITSSIEESAASHNITSSMEASLVPHNITSSVEVPQVQSIASAPTSSVASSVASPIAPPVPLLRVLDVSSNHLRDLNELAGDGERIFAQLREVHRLDLKQNLLEQLPSDLFKVTYLCRLLCVKFFNDLHY